MAMPNSYFLRFIIVLIKSTAEKRNLVTIIYYSLLYLIIQCRISYKKYHTTNAIPHDIIFYLTDGVVNEFKLNALRILLLL